MHTQICSIGRSLTKLFAAGLLLWNSVDSRAQSVKDYLATTTGGYSGVAVASDGAVWYAEYDLGLIGIYKGGKSLIPIDTPTLDSGPESMTIGPDGNIWFVEGKVQNIARINPDRTISETAAPCAINSSLYAGTDALWFAEKCSTFEELVKVSTGGAMSRYIVASGKPFPDIYGIVQTADGKVWFTESARSMIGRIDPVALTIAEYPTQTDFSHPTALVIGPDGDLWFEEYAAKKIAHVDLATIDSVKKVTDEIAWPDTDMPIAMMVGADHRFWAVDGLKRVWQFTVDHGAVSRRQAPSKSTPLSYAMMTGAPDGDIWFVEGSSGANSALGLIRMDGVFTDDMEVTVP